MWAQKNWAMNFVRNSLKQSNHWNDIECNFSLQVQCDLHDHHLLPAHAVHVLHLQQGGAGAVGQQSHRRGHWGPGREHQVKEKGEKIDKAMMRWFFCLQVVKMMMMVVLIFIVCWLPYHTYFITANIYPEINHSEYIQEQTHNPSLLLCKVWRH